MPGATDSLMTYLRTIAGAWRDDPRDDAELLTCFADGHNEVAFRILAWRHGAMVWRTCRRVLGDTQDAEDAFQTVFLTLTRKARRLRREPLAGWLYKVARQAALDIRANVRRRRGLEQEVWIKTPTETKIDSRQTEQREMLDEELAGLPEKLRVPLVLHFLEEKTQEEVARILGCSQSAVQRRLARGEAALRKRMEERGLALGVGSIAALFMGNNAGAPAVPARLIESTAKAAVAFRSGKLTGASLEATEKLLQILMVKGGVRAGWWLVLTCIGLFGVGGIGWVAWEMYGRNTDAVTSVVPPAPETVSPNAATESRREHVDCFGDPLPDGALARIGTLRFRLGHGNTNSGIAFLPDNKTLVSLDENGSVHFWDRKNGKHLRQLDKVGNNISKEPHKIAISPDGKMLACGGEYWDISANPPYRLNREKVGLRIRSGEVAFSPDGKMIAWAGEVDDGRGGNWLVHLVDAATGKVIKTLKDGDGQHLFRHLAFSLDGKTLVTGGGYVSVMGKGVSGETAFWDLATGAKRLQIAGNGNPVTFLAFLTDGQTLLESRSNGRNMGEKMTASDGPERMCFLNSATGKEQEPPNAFHTSLPCCWRPGSKCLSRDGKLLALSDRSAISVWDLETGREVGPARSIHFDVDTLIFSQNGKKLVTLSAENSPNLYVTPELQVWEADSGRLVRELTLSRSGLISPSVYCSDASHLEILFGDLHDADWQNLSPDFSRSMIRKNWNLRRWDLATGKMVEAKEGIPANLATKLKKSSECRTISSDGRWQALASTEGVVVVDQVAGKEIRRFAGTQDANFVTFATDGQSVLIGLGSEKEKNQRLEVWSVATGKLRISLTEPKGERDDMRSYVLSPDGRWLAALDNSKEDNQVHLFEVASGQERECLEAPGSEVQRLAWSPDGCLLAGGDGNGSVWIWDVVTGRVICRLEGGHLNEVTALAFSPNGLRLASGSRDTTAIVWDLQGLSRTKTLEKDRPTLDALWTSLGGEDLAVANRSIHLLAKMPDVVLPLLRERLQPAAITNPNLVIRLLARLDNDSFQVRQQAEEELEKMGEGIEPVLREQLAKTPPPETRQRIVSMLNKVCGPPVCSKGLNSKQLQTCRGVEVLERIGTPAARLVLEQLSRLPKELIQVEEAKAALYRLAKPMP